MAYLLDSNLLIYSADPAHAFLRPFINDPDSFVSVITEVEVLGFHRLDPVDETYFRSLFAVLGILPVTDEVIGLAVMLRQGRRMSLGDSLISATAFAFGLDLATRNVKDFAQIKGLRVYNPFAA